MSFAERLTIAFISQQLQSAKYIANLIQQKVYIYDNLRIFSSASKLNVHGVTTLRVKYNNQFICAVIPRLLLEVHCTPEEYLRYITDKIVSDKVGIFINPE